MANPDHLQQLRSGRWAAWRAANPTIAPDLIDADLSGLDLRGLDFAKAHFRGANLANARLDGATLSHAGLEATIASDGKAILCAQCHLSEALPGNGLLAARGVGAAHAGAPRRDVEEDEAVERSQLTSIGDRKQRLEPMRHPVRAGHEAGAGGRSRRGHCRLAFRVLEGRQFMQFAFR